MKHYHLSSKTIGKQIAEKCHGLPLTIAVVAGLLKSKRSIEDWENVAKDVKSFVTNDHDKQCSRELGLSYNHLSSDLKTCLMHFGIFPEDSEIPVKRLVRSWMAEGFLQLENDLEGEAEKCLQELVDRCLVLVCKISLDGTKIRSCKVHDLIYDLCVREIQTENIFIVNDIVLGLSYSGCVYLSMQIMQPFKRVTGDEICRALLTPVHRQLRDHNNNDLLKRTRSIFSFRAYSISVLKLELIHFKLLHVLDLSDIKIASFPQQILSLVWLRYLSLQCRKNFDIPPEICRLWNLQTFIVEKPGRSVITIPEEIWRLMQFRHLKLPEFNLPNPPNQLETLSLADCSSRFFQASAKAFPATLKKLKLERTWLSWSDLDIIAELPNLEVLKLIDGACHNNEWHPNVRGFTRLNVLLIENNDLKYWKVTDDNFPVLECLVLKKCRYLKEIPIEFADNHSLQLIELTGCLPELGDSAVRIQKEQQDLGNDPVDVRISDPYNLPAISSSFLLQLLPHTQPQ
ncbi:hypothetical protein CQW23_32672 [Capsicum baccatum]|uniref:Uncharacterized protein n=1 Tax=Capsicum baccatum TaxID=33114 RepID=A0A2G2V430_CAPBA|nr:hypothetical protein CQW23_32672 [Capsicum baccatum]